MNINNNEIFFSIKSIFNRLIGKNEMNGGKDKFKIKELEVFQLL